MNHVCCQKDIVKEIALSIELVVVKVYLTCIFIVCMVKADNCRNIMV